MSDVFISYCSNDRPRARQVADALGRDGFSVWWDRDIPPGKSFDLVIEQAVEEARCIVVLWSKESVVSEWVKTEAAEGARRKILVPVLIEPDARIPLEFRRIQAADLSGWTGERTPGYETLVTAVRLRISGPQERPSTSQPAAPVSVRAATPSRPPRWLWAGAMALATLLALAFFALSGGEPESYGDPDLPAGLAALDSAEHDDPDAETVYVHDEGWWEELDDGRWAEYKDDRPDIASSLWTVVERTDDWVHLYDESREMHMRIPLQLGWSQLAYDSEPEWLDFALITARRR
jgi:hypothetical protein